MKSILVFFLKVVKTTLKNLKTTKIMQGVFSDFLQLSRWIKPTPRSNTDKVIFSTFNFLFLYPITVALVET